MNHREMEEKIRTAMRHVTPEDSGHLEKILRSCAAWEGDGRMEQKRKEKRMRTGKWVGLAAAAAVLLAAGGLTGGVYYSRNIAVDSEVVLDVNPSIEIRLNRKEEVVEVAARNQEAAAILDGMDLKGTDLNVAVNALLGSMVKNGYINELANSILVTVENDDQQRGAQIQAEIVAEIDSILSAQSIEGAVLSQNISRDSVDQEVRAIADQYQISLGKASLIQMLTKADPLLQKEELAGLSINELNLLLENRTAETSGEIQSQGTASDKAYIGEEKAKEAAFAHAGVSAAEATVLEIKMDYDDGIVEYDVEFLAGGSKYEYEINASTGDVVSYEKETQAGQTGAAGTGQQPQIPAESPAQGETQPESGTQAQNATQPQSGNTGGVIGEEAARQAALSHAGIGDASGVFWKKCRLDYEDGRQIYEVEFYSGSQEYDYEIDASTGQVLKYDFEQHMAGETGQNGAGITEEQARQIALQRAPGAQILSVKLDYDDGRMIYEIEMREGYTEYDCEIAQSDGTVLKWETD